MTPKSPGETWRAWLLTGVRREPVDRRRIQGPHRGLKKILAEGASEGDIQLRPWRDFSGAMVRQAVNEAMHQLPVENQEVVKLAYFGGLSNREIADELGLSITGVQRRLRTALASVSEHLEHGRTLGRRAALGLLLLLAGRRLGQWQSALATPVASHAAAAAVFVAVVAAAPIAAPPAAVTPGTTAARHSAPLPHQATPDAVATTAANVSVPGAAVPAVKTPPVKLPHLPAPRLPKLPRTPSL